jgi:hypothetical protein
MTFSALESAVGFRLNETPELAALWKTSEKIGHDPIERKIWYKVSFKIRFRKTWMDDAYGSKKQLSTIGECCIS